MPVRSIWTIPDELRFFGLPEEWKNAFIWNGADWIEQDSKPMEFFYPKIEIFSEIKGRNKALRSAIMAAMEKHKNG